MTDDTEMDAGDEMLADPPYWLFEASVDKVPRARIFGPKDKRNLVLWRLSKHTIALEGRGLVSVRRYTNGKWETANDWRNLGM